MSLMTQDNSQVMTTLIMLSVISVIGGLGNGLVIIVYSRKHDHLITTLFINVLAIVDCFTCITIIPMTIYIEYWEWRLSSALICKLYYFFNNSTIPFSAFLISLIAIDRYMCICHPFNKFMTLSRSKISIGIVLLLALLLGITSTFQVKILSGNNSTMVHNSTKFYSTLKTTECADESKIQNSSTAAKIFFNIVQKSQIISYTLCIAIVICLYVAIYSTVLRTRRKKRKLIGHHAMNRSTCLWESPNNVIPHPDQVDTPSKLSDADLLLTSAKSTPNSKVFLSVPKAEPRRVSLKSICDTQIFQNFRTAAMLFVVALMYIISFLPAFLMINNLAVFNLQLFYMYYLNNAANPIIYCFMNPKFREDITAILASFR